MNNTDIAWVREHFRISQIRFADTYREYAAEHTQNYSALHAELTNLMIAVRLYLERGEGKLASEMTVSLGNFWLARGYWTEAAEYADAAASQLALGDFCDEEVFLTWAMLQVMSIVAWWSMGQRDVARNVLSNLIAVARNRGDKTVHDALGLLVGLMATADYRQDEALALYRMALEQVRDLNYPPITALALDMLALALAEHGFFTEAISLYQEKLEIIRLFPNSANLMETLQGLAVIAQKAGMSDLAESSLREAYELAQRRMLSEEQVRTLANLASIAAQHSEFGKASELYRRAIAQARLLDDKPTTADILRHLAFVEDELGKDVGNILEESLSLSREVSDFAGMCRSLIQLGEYHFEKGETDSARNNYEQALHIASRINDQVLEALAWEGLADLAFDDGDLSEAKHAYERSANLYEANNQIESQARALHRLGQVLVADGQHAQAIAAFRLSMALNERIGDQEAVAAGLYMLAIVQYDEGKIDEARQSAQSALTLLKEIGSEHVADVEAWLSGQFVSSE